MTRFLFSIYLPLLTLLLSTAVPASGQNSPDTINIPVMDYSKPESYVIGGITVSGVNYLDPVVLISLSGLSIGDRITIPGDEITKVVKKFWSQGLFSDVKVSVKQIDGEKVYLEYYLQERPRLGKLIISGLRKAETTDLQEKLKLRTGSQVTDDVLNNISIIIKKHFIEKGFFNTQVKITQLPDTLPNRVNLKVQVDKNSRVKIADIIFTGDSALSEAKLRKSMKKTHRRDWNIFKSSKFIKADYKEDRENLLALYNEKGFRDAKILSDSFSLINPKRVLLYINLYEGPRYYFRNIAWIGNTIYPAEYLSAVLGIKKGDVYDQTLLNKRLMADEDAVSNLYLDNGYLFFNLSPEEVLIQNDSIDLEMRMSEGKQATINSIIINGNTKTNEHVIRREIRTLPGELFNRSEIIRTARELAQLGHFDPEKIDPKPIPNPADGSVDIQYNLEERSNDQLSVSGGWGAGMLVGTVGLSFSNFSMRNILHPKQWGGPVPTGDGQTLSIRAQSNGKYYRSYSISFVEPWLGGKKPNSLSVSIYNSKYRNANYDYYTGQVKVKDDGYMAITGGSIGLGQRLTWPDDYFTLYNELSIQRYDLNNYTRSYFEFNDGTSNNLALNTTLGRNSMDQTIYPRKGSSFALTLALTPPYSLISGKDFTDATQQDKYNWIEYYKWSFKAEWYSNPIDKLVFVTRGQFGLKGFYNKDIGQSPFEGFYVGGDGMVGYNYYGYEVIPLRGYSNNGVSNGTSSQIGALTPREGANYFTKYTAEIRYPISLNPQATIYALTFAEAGNAWTYSTEINPFSVRRSAGVGIRAFLPMFGLLGLDWAYGFDEIPWAPGENGPRFHFTIGQQF